MSIAKKKSGKIPEKYPGIFPVSVVAEQIGNRDQQQGVWYCQSTTRVRRILSCLTGNP